MVQTNSAPALCPEHIFLCYTWAAIHGKRMFWMHVHADVQSNIKLCTNFRPHGDGVQHRCSKAALYTCTLKFLKFKSWTPTIGEICCYLKLNQQILTITLPCQLWRMAQWLVMFGSMSAELFASFSRGLEVLDFAKWPVVESIEELDWDWFYGCQACLDWLQKPLSAADDRTTVSTDARLA